MGLSIPRIGIPSQIVVPSRTNGKIMKEFVVDVHARTVRENRRSGAIVRRW